MSPARKDSTPEEPEDVAQDTPPAQEAPEPVFRGRAKNPWASSRDG